MNRHFWITLVTTSLAPLGATLAATPVDREIDAAAKGTLDVRNVAGSIEISGWSKNTVHVTGTLSNNVERLDFRRDGDRVIVDVVLHENSHSYEGTLLKIEAPQASDLDVSAVSANVTVAGIEGEQRIKSVSGAIATEAFASDLDLSSVSGDVTARGHDRSAMTRAHAVSGSIELTGLAGQIQAEAVSGSVDVKAKAIERAILNSISGAVSLRGALDDASRVELTSTSGTLRLLFAGSAAAEYDLTTFSGPIKSCFGPPVAEPSHGPQRQQRFREGTSNARVHASTMSGGIELCRE